MLYNKKTSMKKILRYVKIAWKITSDNYFISIFLLIVAFVGFVSIFKIFTAKGQVVYATVKVSQGLWWANILNAPTWMTQNLKKGDVEKSLTGGTVAEIMDARYYPAQNSQSIKTQEYSIFLTVKLTADYNSRKNVYSFKRSAIGVGSPIEFEFNNAQIAATIIALSNNPPENKYVSKTITLYKPFVDSRDYDGIKIGDTYFDGQEEIIEILDKSAVPSSGGYIEGRNIGFGDNRSNVEIVVNMKLKQNRNNLMYNDEYAVQIGREINFETASYYFDDYRILHIE